MSHQMDNGNGAGIVINEDNPNELVKAMVKIIENLRYYNSEAINNEKSWLEFHNGNKFSKIFLGLFPSQK